MRHVSKTITNGLVVEMAWDGEPYSYYDSVRAFERAACRALLKQTGTVTKAAQLMGLHRTTLIMILKKIGDETPKNFTHGEPLTVRG